MPGAATRIVRAFANANAFSEANAKSIAELGLGLGYGAVNYMVQRGIIIETADGRFYMDRAQYDRLMRRRNIVLPILGGFCVCLIIWFILFYL
jgi:hypothetical protein